MQQLHPKDLEKCLKRLPAELRITLENNRNNGVFFISGGFIRSVITGDKVNDIDINVATMEDVAKLVKELGSPVDISTDNALTLKAFKPAIQIITGWLFSKPEDIIKSHDFTVCGAVIWCETAKEGAFSFGPENYEWKSMCCDTYYQDVAARRLVYQYPKRIEEPRGSTLRIGKYLRKGHSIDIYNLAAVLSRLVTAIPFENCLGKRNRI